MTLSSLRRLADQPEAAARDAATVRGVKREQVALVLAGAVAKGGFHAGVLRAFARSQRMQVTTLVGTSAGALTATVFAAGLATGKVAYAAEVAAAFWLERAGWRDILSVSVFDMLRGRGASGSEKLRTLIDEAVSEVIEGDELQLPEEPPDPSIKLRIVATDLLGHLDAPAEGQPLQATYERCFALTGADLLDDDRRRVALDAAAASATFPGLFLPRAVEGRIYVDGGAVNNAPISYALEGGQVQRVFVVTPHPPVPNERPASGGVGLVAHLSDILINERLFRDINQAYKTNDRIERLRRKLGELGVSDEAQAELFQELGWRTVAIEQIRPQRDLPGSGFAGFDDPVLRSHYVEAGEEQAAALLARLEAG